jgi:hypothetical protein
MQSDIDSVCDLDDERWNPISERVCGGSRQETRPEVPCHLCHRMLTAKACFYAATSHHAFHA